MRNYHHHPFRPRIAQPTEPISGSRPDVAASHVYRQTWEHIRHLTIKGFFVLALDSDDAEIQGGIRLASQGGDVSEWRCIQNREDLEPSLDIITAALDVEDIEEREYREAQFRRREENEPNLNGTSARERIDAGYSAMRERRR